MMLALAPLLGDDLRLGDAAAVCEAHRLVKGRVNPLEATIRGPLDLDAVDARLPDGVVIMVLAATVPAAWASADTAKVSEKVNSF